MREVRVLVIANPQATATSPRRRDVLLRSLGSAGDLRVEETAHRGHAAALATRAMRAGTADVVVSLGGDGTVNEVVTGLLTDGAHPQVPMLGVVPTGSTNVFARGLGLPNDPVEATGVLLEALREGRSQPISMVRADERWVIFAAGLGLDAAVVRAVERQRRKGVKSTHALYARLAVREYFGSERRSPKLSVELADERLEDIHFALITNAEPYTYAGNIPLRPTPGASFATGFGLYARRRMGTPGFLYSLARMAGDRPHVGKRGAYLRKDLQRAVVRASEPTPLQVDGEFLGERSEVRFESHSGALHVAM